MIYLASYEPGGSLYNREREHILGRSLLNFGLMKEYGRTWDVGRILRTFKIKKNVEVTDNGKIII